MLLLRLMGIVVVERLQMSCCFISTSIMNSTLKVKEKQETQEPSEVLEPLMSLCLHYRQKLKGKMQIYSM